MRKHIHTAKRIYDRLVDKYEFTGGESTVRRYVQELRGTTAEVFVPSTTSAAFPGGSFFDHGKVAVKDNFGAHAGMQDTYTALAAHYGFTAVFCDPASGNEKSLVEGLVGYDTIMKNNHPRLLWMS